jgi:ribose transport system substrate-binding protein
MNTLPRVLTRRRAIGELLGSAALATLTGCGQSGTSGGKRHFAVSLQTMNNPFFVELDGGIRKVIEDHGDTLATLDAKLDSAKQRNDLADAILQKPAAIFLNPVNWESIRGSLLDAKRAGVPVITVDTQVSDADLVAAQVASDNVQAGRLAAEALGKVKPNAKIAVMHLSAAKSCLDRVAGFKEAMAKFPGMSIIDTQEGKGSRDVSLPIMKDILGRVGELDAVFAINDPSALGCASAIENTPGWSNRGVVIVTVDGSKDGKDAVKAGRLLATVEQFPIEIGTVAAKMAYDLLDHKPIEKDVKIPVKLFTKDTA